MNSNEIAHKIFDKSALGRKSEEVTQYLAEVADYCRYLENKVRDTEKLASESDEKIEVLASEIRKFRAEEDSLKDAIMSAQRVGQEIASSAKAKALAITDGAKEEVDKLVSEARRSAKEITEKAQREAEILLGDKKAQADREARRFNAIQKEIADFKARLNGLYKRHLELITKLPELELKEIEPDEPAQPVFTPEPVAAPVPAPVVEPAAEAIAPAAEPASFISADISDIAKEIINSGSEAEAFPELPEQAIPEPELAASIPSLAEEDDAPSPIKFIAPSEDISEIKPSFFKNPFAKAEDDDSFKPYQSAAEAAETSSDEDESDDGIAALYKQHENEKTRLVEEKDRLPYKITIKSKDKLKTFDN